MLATWGGYGWGHGGPWMLVFPLFWLAVIVGLVFVFRRRRYPWHARAGEIALAERYARGEISEEEYRQRAAVLREHAR